MMNVRLSAMIRCLPDCSELSWNHQRSKLSPLDELTRFLADSCDVCTTPSILPVAATALAVGIIIAFVDVVSFFADLAHYSCF